MALEKPRKQIETDMLIVDMEVIQLEELRKCRKEGGRVEYGTCLMFTGPQKDGGRGRSAHCKGGSQAPGKCKRNEGAVRRIGEHAIISVWLSQGPPNPKSHLGQPGSQHTRYRRPSQSENTGYGQARTHVLFARSGLSV
jgi:hypothetical protein